MPLRKLRKHFAEETRRLETHFISGSNDMARTRPNESPANRILAILDAHPGQYVAVVTIAQEGCFTGGSRACLPGYITSLCDQLVIERQRIDNPVTGGRARVWGYRRAGAKSDVDTAPIAGWKDRPALGLDPAGWALLNPPRAWQRAESLSNDEYQKAMGA